MLTVSELECVRGDRRLFSGIGFSLEPGELLHLHGHNGSGKTTLLRTLSSLVLPASGEINWNGQNIRDLGEDYTRHVMYIGHKNGIKDDLTALENLQVSSVLDGVDISEQAAWEALARIGLKGFEDLPTKVLSQGQKRRVAMARLLVCETRLWILDEPFVALDKAAVQLLQDVIRQHIANGGMAILTTHQDVPLTTGTLKQLELGWKQQGHV
ncbi:MAG: cytochrome c biogenesis heme-transporting ATPase CcmA [Chromatiales bacterium]